MPGALHPPTPAGPSCLPPTSQHWWQEKARWAEKAWPRKPFLISETGAAGISGWHNGTTLRDFAQQCSWPGRDEPCWSEEFQRDVVASDVAAVVVNKVVGGGTADTAPVVAGLSIWLLIDSQDNRGNCSGNTECQQLDMWRPHALNSKGMATEWRQPKEVFYAVSALFANATRLV